MRLVPLIVKVANPVDSTPRFSVEFVAIDVPVTGPLMFNVAVLASKTALKEMQIFFIIKPTGNLIKSIIIYNLKNPTKKFSKYSVSSCKTHERRLYNNDLLINVAKYKIE